MTMYAKAGSYAEEVLANIKTVVAFGETTFIFYWLKASYLFQGAKKKSPTLTRNCSSQLKG